MKHPDRIFLFLFWVCVFLLVSAPLFFPPAALLKTDLAREFCKPLVCGIFGLGENGTDLWFHTLAASQIAIILSLLVCLTSVCVGVPLGIFASLSRPLPDQTLTLTTNLFLSFPSILIAIALSAFLGQGFLSTWFILSITGWAPFARLSRAAALQVKVQEYILSAESIGCSKTRISLFHILPNILPIILVQAAFQLSGIIIVESTLSFLGLGISQDTPSLGRLIYIGKNTILDSPHAALIPGFFIVMLITGFYLTGMILDQKISHRSLRP